MRYTEVRMDGWCKGGIIGSKGMTLEVARQCV